MLAAVAISGILGLLIQLVIAGLVFWVILWGINYIGIPEPFAKVVKVVLVLAVVVFLVNLLMGLGGHALFEW